MDTTTSSKKSLGAIRRKAVDLSHFNPVRESQLQPDQPLPLIVEPASDQVDLADWARNNRELIEQKLSQHGGILFRGFGLHNAQDFERVAASICRELYSEYGDLPREGVAGQVYTSTPYPEDKSILYHNESSHMSRWPSKINFFCVTVAKEGGATPIVDCRRVYQNLDAKVRDKFENLGLMYVRNFAEGLDVSWPRHVYYGDESPIEDTVMDHVGEIYEKNSVRFQWQQGDLVSLENMLTAHARDPYVGPRKIVVALGDMVEGTELDRAQGVHA